MHLSGPICTRVYSLGLMRAVCSLGVVLCVCRSLTGVLRVGKRCGQEPLGSWPLA